MLTSPRTKKPFLIDPDLVYYNKVRALRYPSLIAYWPLWEASGPIAVDYSGRNLIGAYTAVNLGRDGIGDGKTSASFDGTTSYVNIYSTELNSLFNGLEGTLSFWFKVANAGVWTDATLRRMAMLYVNGSNYLGFGKTTTNNTLQVFYGAGGTAETINSAAVGGDVGWIHSALTWSKTGDLFALYLKGNFIASSATLGNWTGNLSATQTIIGATSTVPANPFNGYIAHYAFWNATLTAGEIETLSRIR